MIILLRKKRIGRFLAANSCWTSRAEPAVDSHYNKREQELKLKRQLRELVFAYDAKPDVILGSPECKHCQVTPTADCAPHPAT
jgi:hypothetical protein